MNKAPTTRQILAEAKKRGMIVTRRPGTLNGEPFYKVQGGFWLCAISEIARRLGYAV